MTGSGLIYAAIVAAWVAYLVPSWVRRGEGRTHVERSTDRMRVLRDGRTRVAPGHPEVAVEAPTARPPAPRGPRSRRAPPAAAVVHWRW